MKVHTVELFGVEGAVTSVEASYAEGGYFTFAGMTAEACVRDSRVRVRSALYQIDQQASLDDVVIAFSPAVRGEGAFDLAVACAAFLRLTVPLSIPQGTVFVGELGLTGKIRPVRGIIPRLIAAREAGFACAVVAEGNAAEAAQVEGLEILVASDLQQVLDWLRGSRPLDSPNRAPASPPCGSDPFDLSELPPGLGRRAIEVAAAGSHNLLLLGPMGSGKTMVARRLPGILPTMNPSEAVVMSAIHSSAGILPAEVGILHARPFRAPHHTVSEAGLVGGGDPPRPGEVSLAHGVVLFLDELAEFRRATLDTLASALRDGEMLLCRKGRYARFPAKPLVVAACNSCPCGYSPCRCKDPSRVKTWMDRVMAGPLASTFDLVVRLPAVSVGDIRDRDFGESTRVVRARVEDARWILDQVEPWVGQPAKVRRVARTLAALDGRKQISDGNAAEARTLCGMEG